MSTAAKLCRYRITVGSREAPVWVWELYAEHEWPYDYASGRRNPSGPMARAIERAAFEERTGVWMALTSVSSVGPSVYVDVIA